MLSQEVVAHIDVLRVRVVTGLTVIWIAPLLSSKTWMHGSPKSGNSKRHTCGKKSASLKPSAIATYSASLEEIVVHFCVLEIHWMAVPPHITAAPETDFLVASLGA